MKEGRKKEKEGARAEMQCGTRDERREGIRNVFCSVCAVFCAQRECAVFCVQCVENTVEREGRTTHASPPSLLFLLYPSLPFLSLVVPTSSLPRLSPILYP